MTYRRPKTIVGPVEEPITIEQARAHIESQPYDDSDQDAIDDAMIEGWIAGAREACEDFVGLSLSRRTLEIALDDFPTICADGTTAIELPMGPVVSIIEVRVGESDSDANLLDPAEYILDDYRSPSAIKPATSWPTVTASTNTIRIRYDAGYGVDSDGGEALPSVLRSAVLLTLGWLFLHREDEGQVELPTAAENLLRPRRVVLGLA